MNRVKQSTRDHQNASILRSWIVACSSIALLVMAAGVIDFVFLRSWSLHYLLRLLIGFVLLWLMTQSHTVILFGLMIANLATRESRGFVGLDSFSSAILIGLSMGILYLSGRYTSIRHSFCRAILIFFSLDPSQESMQWKPQSSLIRIGIEIGWTSCKLGCLILLASLLLQNQPWAIRSQPWLAWTMANKQVLWPGPEWIVVMLGLMILANELSWRRKSPAQSRMMLRFLLIQSLYPDLRRIVRLALGRRKP